MTYNVFSGTLNPTHLLAALPWEVKNSNFPHISSRYGSKYKQIAFWVHRSIVPVSRDISPTVLWVCGLSSWLKTKSLTVSTFSSVRALRSLPLPGRLLTVPVFRSFFNNLLTPRFVQLFSGNSTVNLFAVYPFKYILFNQHLVLVSEYHVACWQTLQWRLLWWISGATNWSQK